MNKWGSRTYTLEYCGMILRKDAIGTARLLRVATSERLRPIAVVVKAIEAKPSQVAYESIVSTWKFRL